MVSGGTDQARIVTGFPARCLRIQGRRCYEELGFDLKGMKTRRVPRRSHRPEVALGGAFEERGLPLPFVHYPNHYGTFFAFSEGKGTDVYLCECGRPALENLIELNGRYRRPPNSNPLRGMKVDNFHVPDIVARIAAAEAEPLRSLRFQKRICHRCNLVTPTRTWCHEMYGGHFKQHFGWYIQQAFLRLGIRPIDYSCLSELCPASFRSQIAAIKETSIESTKFPEGGARNAAWREVGKLKRRLEGSVENIVRKEFGFRKIGEGWIGETLLYQTICRLFPNEEILRHHRPEWLCGLELDIFLPKLRLGVEYQGQQHFQPVEVWGGETALRELQERDRRKRRLCEEAEILLLEVDYTEAILEDHVRRRLEDVGLSLTP